MDFTKGDQEVQVRRPPQHEETLYAEIVRSIKGPTDEQNGNLSTPLAVSTKGRPASGDNESWRSSSEKYDDSDDDDEEEEEEEEEEEQEEQEGGIVLRESCKKCNNTAQRG